MTDGHLNWQSSIIKPASVINVSSSVIRLCCGSAMANMWTRQWILRWSILRWQKASSRDMRQDGEKNLHRIILRSKKSRSKRLMLQINTIRRISRMHWKKAWIRSLRRKKKQRMKPQNSSNRFRRKSRKNRTIIPKQTVLQKMRMTTLQEWLWMPWLMKISASREWQRSLMMNLKKRKKKMI